ncbi:UBX domain-containing protein 8 [Protopterus annectens]|uniref:UBX domain-containing protein 8 n=1 Tax=Protopterus annectens TaxID=7888 RepID=UPI001CFAF55C|nr:UBX domain-containing protein 8 [Protopterus annectens]
MKKKTHSEKVIEGKSAVVEKKAEENDKREESGKCQVSMDHEGWFRDFLLLGGRFLLLLAFLSLVISFITPRINFLSPNVSNPSTEVLEDEKEKQTRARKQQQEKHLEKTTAYLENVLKPRQESQIRKKEEHFYRMTGETWKLTEGFQLGEGEDSEDDDDLETTEETPSKKALRKRKLPENILKRPHVPELSKPKKVIVLPEEPKDATDGAVTVALRCPSGRLFRRRFLTSHSTQILLDWMRKVGYPPEIYVVCTSYPRRPLEIKEEFTLENAGITVDTVLNLEEKEI